MKRFAFTGKGLIAVWVVAAGILAIAARPAFAQWNQFQASQALYPYLYNLPPQTGGFACLTQPLSEATEREVVTKAAARLERSLQILPNQAYTYYLLGRAYCRLGDYAAAARVLPRFSELRPKNPQADLELGFALEKLCPPTGECEDLTTAQVWQRAGVLPEHLIANGEAARKQEDFEQALIWYRRAEQMGADLRSTLAFVEYQRALKEDKQEEAYAALQKAVELDAGWADAEMRFLGWYRYGQWIYEKISDYSFAEEIMQKAIMWYANNTSLRHVLSEAYRYIGFSRFYRGLLEQSVEPFRVATEIFPDNAWAWVGLGKALFLMDDSNLEEAQKHFMTALKSRPDNISLWNDVINFWLQTNNNHYLETICLQAKKSGFDFKSCNNFEQNN